MGAPSLVDPDAMDELCARLKAAEEQIELLQTSNTDHPEQEICTGPFIDTTGLTGWLHGWTTPVQNANQAQVLTDWIKVGQTVDGPDCVHDAKVTVDVGNHYFILRRIRAYLWIDVRIVRNGVVCHTETYDAYEYIDERGVTNPDVVPPTQTIIFKPGNSNLTCFNSPAGATYDVEVRYRYQSASFQSSSYFRFIGGLRSEGDFVFLPREIVTGRI